MFNKYSTRKGAFSLIELMVVIAIVGVLAAVSVPVYKTYVARADMFSKGLYYMDLYATEAIKYYNLNGVFPSSNSDINVPATSMTDYIPGTYLIDLTVENHPASPGQCPYGDMFAYASNYDGDHLTNSSAPVTQIVVSYVDVNGTVMTYCNYQELDGLTFTPTGRALLSNCINGLTNDVANVVSSACT